MNGAFFKQSFATAGFSIAAFDFGTVAPLPEPPAATTGGGRLGARRKLPRRTPSRADTWLELRCTVSTSAGLSIHADAAVDAHSAIESVAGLQIAVAADVAQHAAIESTADVNDVLLEILMMA